MSENQINDELKNINGILKELITDLSENYTKEIKTENIESLNALIILYHKDKTQYFKILEKMYSDLNMIIKHPLELESKENRNIQILHFITNGTYKHFIRRYIEKQEGHSCCADKANFIFRKTIRSLIENKTLSLYDNYEGEEKIKKSDWQKQAYWSPTSFKNTEEAIQEFKKWYYF